MAKLIGSDYLGPKSFDIRPGARCGTKDSTDYVVVLESCDREHRVESAFSLAGWQLGHYDVWAVAVTFAQVGHLVGLTLPLHVRSPKMPQRACVYETAEWLRVVMWTDKRGNTVCIQMFIAEPDSGGASLFRDFFLRAAVDDTERFGRELCLEILSSSPQWAEETGLSSESVPGYA